MINSIQSEMHQPATLTLFLMTQKGYEFLKATTKKYKSLFKIVVIGCDKSIEQDFEQELINFCNKNNINWIRKLDFKIIKTEYIIAVSWRWLIKHPIEKIVVFHDSPLPRYRGFSPLVNALINGENEIGVTAILGANDFDTGGILAQSKSKIKYPIKISNAIQLNNKNYLNCAEIVLNMLLLTGNLPTAQQQDEKKASYSVWRDEIDYQINWNKSAAEIRRFVDAVGSPYKGALTMIDKKIVRILSVEESTDVNIVNRDCGKVLFINDGKHVVICGKGMLKITEAYIENDVKMPLSSLAKFRLRFA